MSLARKMKRRNDVLSSIERRHAYAQGQRQGVANMIENTEKKLREAYDMGYNEANMKCHALMSVCAIAALRDTFGFGEIKAKRFAEKLEELTDAVNSGQVTVGEIMKTLVVEDKIRFLDVVEVDDGEGHKYRVSVDELLKAEEMIKGA